MSRSETYFYCGKCFDFDKHDGHKYRAWPIVDDKYCSCGEIEKI